MDKLYLSFSDSAKFAQAASRMLSGDGFSVTHSFFNVDNINFTSFKPEFFPLVSLLMATPLKLLGVYDSSIIIGGLFLFLLTLYCLFYSGYKLSGSLTGLIAVIIFPILPGVWEYFYNFSSESVAMFFLSLSFALWLKSKQKAGFSSPFFYLLTIISRPQLICLSLAYLLIKKKFILSSLIFLIIVIFGFTYRQAFVSLNFAPSVPQGQYLRGREVVTLSPVKLASKTFYNTYNFLKSPERLIPVGVLVIAIIRFNLLTLFSLISSTLLIIMSSLTLPNARYVHPILPLYAILFAKNLPKKSWSVIILILMIIPFVGKYTLDQRNTVKQEIPVYKQISDQIATVLPKNELIITNLDAWTAWYHGLSTMWFPNSVEQIKSNPPKYIAISNYLKDDADFSLNDWTHNDYISTNYLVLKQVDTPDYSLTIWQKSP